MIEQSCPLEPMPYLQSRAVSMNLADDYWAAAAAAATAAAASALPPDQPQLLQQRHIEMSSCGGQPQPARPRYRLQQPLSLTERNSAPPGTLEAAMAMMPAAPASAPTHPLAKQQAAANAVAAGGAPQETGAPMAVDDVPEEGWVVRNNLDTTHCMILHHQACLLFYCPFLAHFTSRALPHPNAPHMPMLMLPPQAAVTCHERFKQDRQAVLLSNTLVQFLFADLHDVNPQVSRNWCSCGVNTGGAGPGY